MADRSVDIAIVGAGIVGLAHALAAAKRGYRVAVFERHPQAVGASIRNFGMIWPIGQPQGPLLEQALQSRTIWQTIASQAGFALDPCGSLHLAYRHDELAVLEEFVDQHQGNTVHLLSPAEATTRSPAVVSEGLLGALWSSTELIVDPREVLSKLPHYLHECYGVHFYFGRAVTSIAFPDLIAGRDRWRADHILICSGSDFATLYPDLYATSGLTKVKLQMMRTVPQPHGFRIGAALCGGLTLTHYAAFAQCPSLGALKTRIQQETPQFPHWGVHVMMSQNAQGELVIGDSHEYGLTPDPFDRPQINQLILDYLQGFARVPTLQMAATWHGLYAKLPGHPDWIAQPEPGVTLVNGLGGAGMTLSFGLADAVMAGI